MNKVECSMQGSAPFSLRDDVALRISAISRGGMLASRSPLDYTERIFLHCLICCSSLLMVERTGVLVRKHHQCAFLLTVDNL